MSNLGPSWLGIGAQRCGTTWFTDLLVQHPLLDVPGGKKEHHWLYRYGLMRDWTPTARDEYREAFTDETVKLGEFTPYYLRSSWVCEIAADALPGDAPILVLVRDPVDRFASAVRHSMEEAARRYRKHLKANPRDRARVNKHYPRSLPPKPKKGSRRKRRRALLRRVARASSLWWVKGPPKEPQKAFADATWLRFVGSDASWGGMYAAQLGAWTNVLPDERFIVIQYEKLRQDPQHYADLVWQRLGLEPVPLTATGAASRSSTETEKWIPEDYPHVVRALQQMYRPDSERLAARFDIDLNLWKRTMADA